MQFNTFPLVNLTYDHLKCVCKWIGYDSRQRIKEIKLNVQCARLLPRLWRKLHIWWRNTRLHLQQNFQFEINVSFSKIYSLFKKSHKYSWYAHGCLNIELLAPPVIKSDLIAWKRLNKVFNFLFLTYKLLLIRTVRTPCERYNIFNTKSIQFWSNFSLNSE